MSFESDYKFARGVCIKHAQRKNFSFWGPSTGSCPWTPLSSASGDLLPSLVPCPQFVQLLGTFYGVISLDPTLFSFCGPSTESCPLYSLCSASGDLLRVLSLDPTLFSFWEPYRVLSFVPSLFSFWDLLPSIVPCPHFVQLLGTLGPQKLNKMRTRTFYGVLSLDPTLFSF